MKSLSCLATLALVSWSMTACTAEPSSSEPICYTCLAEILAAMQDQGGGELDPATDGAGTPDPGPVDTGGDDAVAPPDTGKSDVGPPDTVTPPDNGSGVDPIAIQIPLEDGGTYSAKLEVAPTVTGGGVVLGVEFKVDTVSVSTDLIPPYSYVINTADFGDGDHTITVETADDTGQWAVAKVDVIFDNTPPEFAWYSPAQGEPLFFEDGPLHMEAVAEDVNPLQLVEFHANGLPAGDFAAPPYEADVPWDDLFIKLEDLPANIYLNFYAKDLLGLETDFTFDAKVYKRFIWQYETVGEIWATAVELPNTNIVFGNFGKRLYCMNTAGEVVWDINAGGAISVPPVYDPGTGRILMAGLDSILYSITTGGSVQWSTNLNAPSSGQLRVVGNSVILASYTGFVRSYQTSSGSLSWQVKVCDNIASSSVVVAPDGNTMYVGCFNTYLYALNSGGVIWSKETGKEIWGQPILGPDGAIYVGSNDGWFYAQLPDGTDKWVTEIGGQLWGQPLMGQDGAIYLISTSKYVTKLDAIDGTILWETDTNQGLTYSGPVQGPDGTIYVATTGGRIFALDPTTGKIKWNLLVDDGYSIHAAPLIVDKVMYIGTTGRNFHAIRLAP